MAKSSSIRIKIVKSSDCHCQNHICFHFKWLRQEIGVLACVCVVICTSGGHLFFVYSSRCTSAVDLALGRSARTSPHNTVPTSRGVPVVRPDRNGNTTLRSTCVEGGVILGVNKSNYRMTLCANYFICVPL